jgi:hypothetical protein
MGKFIRVRLKDITPYSNLDWSQEQLDMKSEIINNYSPRIKPILISKDNWVCDGNHRYTILMEHYGGEHKIIVKKINFSKRTYATFTFVFHGVIALITLPFYVLTQIIKLPIRLINLLKIKKNT